MPKSCNFKYIAFKPHTKVNYVAQMKDQKPTSKFPINLLLFCCYFNIYNNVIDFPSGVRPPIIYYFHIEQQKLDDYIKIKYRERNEIAH